MSWNGSGVFTRTYGATGWTNDANAGTLILASRHDTNDDDLSTGINACLTRNNEAKPTANFAPAVDDTYDLGTSSLRWRTAYLGTSLVFQGATYATTVTSAPTANRAVTMPDTAGGIMVGLTGTEKTTTGGTSIDWTDMTASCRRVTLTFIGVSSSGTDPWLLRLGTSGTPASANYRCTAAALLNGASVSSVNDTTGFQVFVTSAAAVMHGRIVLDLENATQNYWTCTATLGRSDAAAQHTTYGSIQLAGDLDIIRLTTTGGTDTFDAVRIGVLYE